MEGQGDRAGGGEAEEAMSRIGCATLLGIVLWASAPLAHAHISLEQGGTHNSRYGDDEIKAGPCGRANGMRGTNVYMYRPGETINITVVETIPHPGYFRIAFDQDGHDGFVVPAGTEGTNGNCSGDANCGPGKADYCSNETVLLDNLSQHAPGLPGTRYTFTVTLPNVECQSCTLQVIQMMNDLNVHRAAYPADDIYYQCIDIVLSNTAMDMNVTPMTNNGMVCDQPMAPDAGIPMGTGGMPGMMDGGVPMAGMGGMVPPPNPGVDAGSGVPAPPSGTGGTSGVPNAPVTGGTGGTPTPGGVPTVPPITMMGATSSSGSDDGGGCSTTSARSGGVLALGLALIALFVRRNRVART
jgi:hypothetical protein